MRRKVPVIRLFIAVLLLALPVLAEEYTVQHHTGSLYGAGYNDATGRDARVQYPAGAAADAAGNVYVADKDAHTVRRIAPDGVVTTWAGLAGVTGSANGRGGAARFLNPQGVAVDGNGNVYIGDDNGVRKISPQRVVSTLANVSAYGLDVDAAGNVFAASSLGGGNYVVRKITPQGSVTQLAATQSSSWIRDVVVDPASGDVFYSAGGLYRYSNGVSTFVAGGVDFVALESPGTLVTANSLVVERMTFGGTRTLIAGDGSHGAFDGPGPQARFSFIAGVAVAPGGLIYVTEGFSTRVRKIAADNVVSTIVGGDSETGHVNGPLADARFNHPSGIARDSSGNLYVADTHNRAIRKIATDGTVSTLAGGNFIGHDDGNGPLAAFLSPAGIAVDGGGNVYVTDNEAHTVRKITPSGDVTTLAGLGGTHGAVNGIGSEARFRRPNGIVVDPAGDVYVADSGNHVIRRITPAGVVSTFAGTFGNIGSADATGAAASFDNPFGLTRTSDGSLYVLANQAVRKVTTPGAVVTTFAGTSGAGGTTDATGTAARFLQPSWLGADSNDNVFVADNFVLRKVTPAAVVTTVAGVWYAVNAGNVSGTGELARFAQHAGMAGDGSGNLYLVDHSAQNIRFVSPPGIADAATVSTPAPPVGSVVTLGTTPDTATSWTWSVLRRPSGSTAQLSSTTAKTPTFTPAVADLFVMLLRAEGPAGVRYSTVSFTATEPCEPLGSVVASVAGSPALVCLTGTGATATSAVSGGGNETYQWGWRASSGGAITSIGGATSASYPLEGDDFGGTLGTKYLVLTVTSDCGVSLVSNELTIQVVATPVNEISASSGVYASSTSNFASVPDAGPGTTYAWSINNGTLTAGQGTRSITYTAGSSGEVTLGVTISNGCEVNGQVYVPIITRPAGASLLYLVTPCRVIDTRGNPVPGGTTRTVTIGGTCNVPVGATALALNLTVIAPSATGFASLYPSNVPWPGNSTINYRPGRTRANNAVVAVAPDGTINLFNAGATTDFIIDVTGYFQ